MKRGSITVFAALSMMLTASLLFTLLESARIYGLQSYADMKTEAGVVSACAEYQPLLWQDYGLLLLDGAGRMEMFSVENTEEAIRRNLEKNLLWNKGFLNRFRLDLFRLKEEGTEMTDYQLLTDGKGEVFLNLISERMKETLPIELAEAIYERIKEGKKIEDGAVDTSALISNANKQIRNKCRDEAKTKCNERLFYNSTDRPESDILVKNPLEFAAGIRESPVLELVVEDVSQISQKNTGLRDSLLRRKKEAGTMEANVRADWYRKILALGYLNNYYSCYTKKQENHFMEYEMEYVLCGKTAEKENLEGAVNRLLLIREAANILYLTTDKEKMDLAEAIATVIGLLAEGNEAVIKAVKAAIIGAWAFLESVLDVRSLLAGEKIPLIKNEKEWTTNVNNLAESFREHATAKKCESGLLYSEYLLQMIFFVGNEKLAYRMMEVMEAHLKNHEAYGNCRMDHMIVMFRCTISYCAEPVFYHLSVIGRKYRSRYYFKKEYEFSFFP